ncbi:hypothetical protein VNO78_25300 [Psophocarpus tetragonolobus]|uniref:Uncharacterized protein n=1 Tax=Psophocarpus tetragonolobus TaxID=3891 RepID=A0AAN9S9V5_PSOTE
MFIEPILSESHHALFYSYAVVTGANKGIGLEIVRQLASVGIKVVLTARNEERGLRAVETLKASASALSHLVLFHHVDVADAASVASLADFVKSKFGKLDILVNNAGVGGSVIKDTDLITSVLLNRGAVSEEDGTKAISQTYELAEECLKINYYGTKTVVQSLLPLLQLSDSPRIVHVSSTMGQLESLPKGSWAREVLSDADNITEEKVDEILKKFLRDFQEGSLESKGWPKYLGAYILSKAAMNAYTRILTKRYPSFCINSVCPGYVKTDITCNTGFLTAEEGAASPVRLALLPNGSPSGLFYYRSDIYVSAYQISINVIHNRCAVVTGANKGIGLEIINNAGVGGIVFEDVDYIGTVLVSRGVIPDDDRSKAIVQTYELAEECIQINYYGSKVTTEALIPLLQLSDSPRIVNVSATLGQLESFPEESWAKGVFNDADNLTEERVDDILKKFLKDFQEGSLESNGWPKYLGAYIVSKAAMNAYTRILAKKYPSFCINCICPGYVRTDLSSNTGFLTVEEGAASPVRLALLPHGSPSGLFYYRNDVAPF